MSGGGEPVVVALDQGTTSTRAIAFDASGRPVAQASRPLEQIYPQAGWVEHDPRQIADHSLAVLGEVLAACAPAPAVALGITNQRETVVLWERGSGRPLHNAIVWQDRRTSPACEAIRAGGHEALITARTGLLADPYFSATKIAWLLDHIPGARKRAEAGELAAGTVDSWLIWTLTGGRVHACDETNASRTLLFDIGAGRWDEELLALFDVPAAILPQVRPCRGSFGRCEAGLLGQELEILGVAGDQQAAAFGQGCFGAGATKATFGTGCFVLANCGAAQIASANRLLTTIADAGEGKRQYALEGSIFMAGAVVQWLRDSLGLIGSAVETEALAAAADPASGVFLVPAFQGLGAPWWDADARGLICGLSRAAGKAEIVRAALEGVAFQTRDLIDALGADMVRLGLDPLTSLRVDGGMAANDWFAQCLADTVGLPVERAALAETTALGAAYHAGLAAGVWDSKEDLAQMARAATTFEPRMGADERGQRYGGWRRAVERTRERAG
ncbi:MAG TPA: glycerol kinase GlpK [Hyphomicrobiales bacterium]|nr:glycerol kinase GlpK [Rhodobiaceae bacterium]HXK53714.1 glycerol kinase GlpK [Hyphomicrobiales bacterium]